MGLLLGVVEDLIAITLATEKEIDFRVFVVALLVAFPFAIFSELVVDHDKFKGLMRKWFRKS